MGDVTAALVILGGVTSPFQGRGDWEVSVPIVLLGLILGAALAFRRRYPVVVLAITVVFTVVMLVLGVTGPVIQVPTAIAIYAVAWRLPRTRAWILSSVAAAVLLITYVMLTSANFFEPSWIAVLAVPAFAAALGSYNRSRRELLVATEARAREAEESKEWEARQRVAEERLRIARDLHDVVAHQIAAVSLHAELVERAFESDPKTARASLEVIKSTARLTLHEIADLMKVLRETPERLPSPSLKSLNELLQRYRGAGLRIDLEISGDVNDLPAVLDTVAYRVVQEGLTNAAKYSSDGVAQLRFNRDARGLVIEIQNKSVPKLTASDASGFGLLGMRERVATVDGEVRVSVDDGGVFLLTVILPLDQLENS